MKKTNDFFSSAADGGVSFVQADGNSRGNAQYVRS
jgi:hypothetical protein